MIVPREGYREDTARYSQAQQQDGKQWTQLGAKGILAGIREKRCSQVEGLSPETWTQSETVDSVSLESLEM